jgi:hypothetical protein
MNELPPDGANVYEIDRAIAVHVTTVGGGAPSAKASPRAVIGNYEIDELEDPAIVDICGASAHRLNRLRVQSNKQHADCEGYGRSLHDDPSSQAPRPRPQTNR